MESGHSSKPRMNLEDDRLSMLPDDLIHRILSLIDTKYAIQTSALSSRWRFIWTSMPFLNLSTDGSPHFPEFVNHVLSHRNDKIEVHSVKLSFHLMFARRQTFSEILLKRILDFAFSHNVEQLSVTLRFFDGKIEFPSYLLCSQSLKHLKLTGSRTKVISECSIVLASTLELPALTTLHLDYVVFCEENDDDDKGLSLFSKCANLKNLTISHFTIMRSRTFTVCHPRLSNLTLEYGDWRLRAVNVVAPQLENLTIRSCYGKHLITAPNLASLLFYSSCLLQFSTDLHYLEKVDLQICDRYQNGCTIAAFLPQLHNVKFLTLNLEFLKPLISDMEGISLQPSPFSNLKSLKIYPLHVPDEAHRRVNMSTEVMNYLLDGSPSATCTLISYEETKEKQQKARAFGNAAASQKLMEILQVMLDKEKAIIETKRTHMDQPMEADAHDDGMAPVEEKVQLQFERKMALMKSRWKDVASQMDRGRTKTCDIISQLHDIEVSLLKDLPASKRDKLQACFYSLRAEVDVVLKKLLHHVSDCINELATSLSSS